MAVEWTRDSQAETLLKEKGVKYRIVKGVKLGKVLIKESLKNNARLDAPLDDDVVTDYAVRMQQPDARFPMPIMHERREGEYVLSGNHRVGAAELAEVPTIDIYQVYDCDDDLLLDDIVRTANRLHGKRQDREEALRHAYSQMQRFSLSAPDVALKFGIDEKALQRFVRADKIRVNLQLAGVGSAKDFSSTVLLSLGRLSDNTTVLREAAKAVGRLGLTVTECDDFVQEIRHAPKQESDQLATIGRFAATHEAKVRERRLEARKMPLKQSFTTKMRSLLKFMRKRNATGWPQLQVTGLAEQQELTHETAELQAYLSQLLGGPRVPKNASRKAASR